MKRLFLIGALAACLTMQGQVTKEEAMANMDLLGGVYLAYPAKSTHPTPPPAGYKPFYISHYGRHGSRYLIGDNDYKWVVNLMNKAKEDGALTEFGENVTLRLDTIFDEANYRGGDLTSLGKQQHRQIAERMYRDYPEVFENPSEISARSTMVVRCVLSMDAFCERLKELDPSLPIDRDASHKWVRYLSYGTKEAGEYNDNPANWKDKFAAFEKENIKPDALMKRLFKDRKYVKENVNPEQLMWGLYWIAADLQDMDTDISLYDVLTAEEMFSIWQADNLRWYLSHIDPTAPDNVLQKNAQRLLTNFLETADEVIASGENTATLRFGHDGNLLPLVALMQLAGYTEPIKSYETSHETVAINKIVPMAGNLQLVFFRNESNPQDVLVKFLLNEQEVTIPVETSQYPFYKWTDVRRFLEDKIK